MKGKKSQRRKGRHAVIPINLLGKRSSSRLNRPDDRLLLGPGQCSLTITKAPLLMLTLSENQPCGRIPVTWYTCTVAPEFVVLRSVITYPD